MKSATKHSIRIAIFVILSLRWLRFRRHLIGRALAELVLWREQAIERARHGGVRSEKLCSYAKCFLN
jgi:hypothetical protein